MQASTAPPPVSSTLYHARLAPKRTYNPGEARASRDRLSVGDVALELAVTFRAGAARASIGVHAKVPSAGAGATRCAVLGPDQLSTTRQSNIVALKTCAASKLFRCSGVVMAASAWVLVDDEEGRRRPPSGERFYALRCKCTRRALFLLLALIKVVNRYECTVYAGYTLLVKQQQLPEQRLCCSA
jgi:hypothetical protein